MGSRFERGSRGNQPEGASAGRPTKGMRRQLYLVGKDDPTVRTVGALHEVYLGRSSAPTTPVVPESSFREGFEELLEVFKEARREVRHQTA